jgi:hypothetical protein
MAANWPKIPGTCLDQLLDVYERDAVWLEARMREDVRKSRSARSNHEPAETPAA